MLRNIIFLIIASILVIALTKYIYQVLQLAINLHEVLISWFAQVFSRSKTGLLLTKLLALFIIPLVSAGIIAGIYWIFKRKSLPIFNEVMWVLWIILATVLVITK